MAQKRTYLVNHKPKDKANMIPFRHVNPDKPGPLDEGIANLRSSNRALIEQFDDNNDAMNEYGQERNIPFTSDTFEVGEGLTAGEYMKFVAMLKSQREKGKKGGWKKHEAKEWLDENPQARDKIIHASPEEVEKMNKEEESYKKSKAESEKRHELGREKQKEAGKRTLVAKKNKTEDEKAGMDAPGRSNMYLEMLKKQIKENKGK
jgi:NAD(P)H-flavin reductase